ncbi:hypothetical protein HPB49_013194 [Dermacentor silvarum]|uniref:Uncharacterized protein n=1 Tax=Dermacentor silvarum TaxID=543639 RepID=A0ACB8C9G7_DERSI|nr:hypothetical protein HPB49_013194 [Dermacentor silvarum]
MSYYDHDYDQRPRRTHVSRQPMPSHDECDPPAGYAIDSNTRDYMEEHRNVRPLPGSSTTDWPKEVYKKKRMNLQGTKKKGCAATMNLKWIELYPDFQVDLPQPCSHIKEGRLKADKAKQLQEALHTEQQTVAKETRVYLTIAYCGSHRNHGVEDMEAFS